MPLQVYAKDGMTFAKGSEIWAFMCSWFPDKQYLTSPNNVSEEVPLILVLDDKTWFKRHALFAKHSWLIL